MAGDPTRRAHARIDVAEVNWVEVSDDGRHLCLNLRDRSGRAASVSLPVECMNAVLTAAPPADGALPGTGQDKVHRLESWSLAHDANGLLLTLHLPAGACITFAVKPWQIAAMASLVGEPAGPERRSLN